MHPEGGLQEACKHIVLYGARPCRALLVRKPSAQCSKSYESVISVMRLGWSATSPREVSFLRRGLAAGVGKTARECRIVSAKPLEIVAVDREHPEVARRPDARRACAGAREKGPFADE